MLFDTLSPKQREAICFAWDYQDPKRGLLRTRVVDNWNITEQFINERFLHEGSAGDHPRHLRGHHQSGVARADRQAAGRRCGRLRRAEQHRDFRPAGEREVRVRDDGPAHDDSLRRQHGRARGVWRSDLLRPRGRRLQRRADASGQCVLAAGAGGEQALSNARRQAAGAGAVADRFAARSRTSASAARRASSRGWR